MAPSGGAVAATLRGPSRASRRRNTATPATSGVHGVQYPNHAELSSERTVFGGGGGGREAARLRGPHKPFWF